MPRRSTRAADHEKAWQTMTPNPNTVTSGGQPGATQGQAQPSQNTGQSNGQGSGQMTQGTGQPSPKRFTDWASI